MNNKTTIEQAFTERATLSPTNCPEKIKKAIAETIHALNTGELRVAQPAGSGWKVNTWLKQAVLLSFRIHANQVIQHGAVTCYDKVDLRFTDYTANDFAQAKIRVVPGAIVRSGSYVGPNVVLMPSFVNIGAYIGEGTLVDTWASVGSCAQIGKNVHLSGGAGIGGVLEPLQANPTIIEDNVFIGARSEIVEGVIVEKNAVIGMGVFIGQSTKIFNRATGDITTGRVPAGSVVVPGSLPSKEGTCQLNCAVIVKQVDDKTRAKTSINELLRT
jgi:2,3,4,5-tetrahydropyridine-2,6-dicarboxylate N-succinyltransferase